MTARNFADIDSLVRKRFQLFNHMHLPLSGDFSGLLVPHQSSGIVWSSFVGGEHSVPVAIGGIYVPFRTWPSRFAADMVSNTYDHIVVKGALKHLHVRGELLTVPPQSWPTDVAKSWDIADELLVMADGWIPVMIPQEPECHNLKGFAGCFAVLVHSNGDG